MAVQNPKIKLLRGLVGIAASIVLMYMSYASLDEASSLGWPAVVSMLALIIILIHGTKEFARILESWDG